MTEGQGTLAVIDTARFMVAGFPDALRMMDATLNAQPGPRADGEFLYYDELRSVEGSIRYSPTNDIYRRVEGTGFVGRLESVGVRFRGLRGYCRFAELHDQRR